MRHIPGAILLVLLTLAATASGYPPGDCGGHVIMTGGSNIRLEPSTNPEPAYLWVLAASGGGEAFLIDGEGHSSTNWNFEPDVTYLFSTNRYLEIYFNGGQVELYYGGAEAGAPLQPICNAATLGPVLILGDDGDLVGIQSSRNGPPPVEVRVFGRVTFTWSGSLEHYRLEHLGVVGQFLPEPCEGDDCCDPVEATFPILPNEGDDFGAYLVLSEDQKPIHWDFVAFRDLECGASADPVSGETPLEVTFTGEAEGGTGGYSFDWDFGDGKSKEGRTVTHKYKTGGTFQWELTVTDLGGNTCGSEGTIVTNLPFALTASPEPRSGHPPLTVSFGAEAEGGTPPYTYAWEFGDGEASDEQNPTHVYNEVKKWLWTVTAADAEGREAGITGDVYCGVPIDPAITKVKKLTRPFRLKIKGRDFQPGCTVFIDGSAVPQTAFKKASKIVAKKKKPLKEMVPKGQEVCVQVLNPDGGISDCFWYTR